MDILWRITDLNGSPPPTNPVLLLCFPDRCRDGQCMASYARLLLNIQIINITITITIPLYI